MDGAVVGEKRGSTVAVGSVDASVIVATRNRSALLHELIASLALCDPRPLDLVVVDDASDEPVDSTVVEQLVPFRVRVLRNPASVGPGASRNQGVHHSRGSILLFTDDDCLVEPNWVAALSLHFRDGKLPRLGGVGGRVLARDQDALSRYFEFHRILEPRPHDAANPNRIPYLVTANCAVRRDVFMRAGGFDERIPTAGGEDAALSMRIVKRGYYFERVQEAVVRHRFRPGLRDFARTFYRYGLGGRYVVDRYLPL